jgi:hypothetical protein
LIATERARQSACANEGASKLSSEAGPPIEPHHSAM